MTGLFSALLIFRVQVYNNEFILLSIEKENTKANQGKSHCHCFAKAYKWNYI